MTKIIKDIGNEYAENDKDKQALAQWRTQAEAAEILGVSSNFLGNYRKSGIIYAYKIGNQWLYKLSDLEKFKKERYPKCFDEEENTAAAGTPKEPEKEIMEDGYPSFDEEEIQERKPAPWEEPIKELENLTFTGIPSEQEQLASIFENNFQRFETAFALLQENFKKMKECMKECNDRK